MNKNEDIIKYFNNLSQIQNKIDKYEKRAKELKEKLILLDTEHKKWQEEKTKLIYSLESSLQIALAPKQHESERLFFSPQESKNEIMLNNLLTHMFTEPVIPPSPVASPRVQSKFVDASNHARSPTSGLSIRRKN